MTSSLSATTTFTRTHAKYLASKVIADLYQCSRLYGRPGSGDMPAYESELIDMLAGGYVAAYEFGFKQDGRRVLAWQYSVDRYGELIGGQDDSAGRLYARADTSSASYFNFLSYSAAWWNLASSERDRIKSGLAIQRTTGDLPVDGNGYWTYDRSYSNGGVAVSRRTFRPS